MYEQLHVKIKGTLPCLQQNGRMKNPLDPWAKEIRKYSKKRTKTDEDHISMMEAEFKGSLYVRDESTGNGIYWPADNVHACIKTWAKQKKLGKVIDSAGIVRDDVVFDHDGPDNRNSLWESEEHRYVKATRRGTMCCRPIFREWACHIDIEFISDLLDREDLKSLIVDAGKYLGLSAWPRRFGLFEVTQFSKSLKNESSKESA